MKGGLYVEMSDDMNEILESTTAANSCGVCVANYLGMGQAIENYLTAQASFDDGIDDEIMLIAVKIFSDNNNDDSHFEYIDSTEKESEIKNWQLPNDDNHTNTILNTLDNIFSIIPPGYASILGIDWGKNNGHWVVIAKDVNNEFYLIDQAINMCSVFKKCSETNKIVLENKSLQGIYKGKEKIIEYFKLLTAKRKIINFATIEKGKKIFSSSPQLRKNLGDKCIKSGMGSMSTAMCPMIVPKTTSSKRKFDAIGKKKQRTRTRTRTKPKSKNKSRMGRSPHKPKKQRTRRKPKSKNKSRMGRSPHKPKKAKN